MGARVGAVGAVACLVLAFPASGAEEVDFVESVSERAIQSLEQERAEAVELLRALVLEAVAFEDTVRFLGKPLGPLDDEQSAQFEQLMLQYLSCLLFINLRSVTAVHDVSIAKTTSKGTVFVRSRIERPKGMGKVDKPVYWILRRVDGEPKLADLRIENISVIRGRQAEIESDFKRSQSDYGRFVAQLGETPAIRPLCE